MRVLFSSLSAYGHFFQLLPLALAARDEGHQVVFATGEVRHKMLTGLGLEVVAAGRSTEEVVAQAAHAAGVPVPSEDTRPNKEAMEAISMGFCRLMPQNFVEDLAPVLAGGAVDLVIHGAYNPGAGLAARVAGVPVLCHGTGRARPADDQLIAMSEVVLREYGAELGVELPEVHTTYLGHPYLDITPASLQDPGFLAGPTKRVELRPVPFAPPGELPAWVRSRTDERPLVYMTLGTESDGRVINTMRQVIAGLSTLDAQILVATPKLADEFRVVPDNVVVERWVAQAELLPHVDLVVQHGGNGTTFATMATGVPQLFIQNLPGPDQLLNADMVCAAGAGEKMLLDEVSAEAVATAAKSLLVDTERRDAARRIADDIAAMPSPAEVARQLPALA
ncbi:glycosyltransferase [Actinophytocola sp.]|jgi:UDP:flavonoid glycosyltransferase YjiC (YdhE family)|uniref:glycosyltransferase n=1 Tax=Actinophytocola sp. TaxID=1872138 RepID=UPI002EDAF232